MWSMCACVYTTSLTNSPRAKKRPDSSARRWSTHWCPPGSTKQRHGTGGAAAAVGSELAACVAGAARHWNTTALLKDVRKCTDGASGGPATGCVGSAVLANSGSAALSTRPAKNAAASAGAEV